jgi:hypothetical protein
LQEDVRRLGVIAPDLDDSRPTRCHLLNPSKVVARRLDNAWHQYILEKLANDLELYTGHVFFQVSNLHIYEKHFHLIK